MLHHLLDGRVLAHALDRARFPFTALHAERDRALLVADRNDPYPAGPGSQLAHQILAELARRMRQRIDLYGARLETHEPHLRDESVLELEVPLRLGKRDDVLEALQLELAGFLWRGVIRSGARFGGRRFGRSGPRERRLGAEQRRGLGLAR